MVGVNAGQSMTNVGGIPGSDNVGIGYIALRNSTSGFQNLAVGTQSGVNITTGYGNCCVGTLSGSDLTTGRFNVYLGNRTKASSGNVNNETVIGYDVTGNGNNTTTIGGTTGVYMPSLNGGGTVYSTAGTGQLTNTPPPSDPSLKTNIVPLSVSVDLLNPVQFEWIDKNKYGSRLQFGFLANEVQSIFPNLVSTWTDDDGSEKLALDIVPLIPVLTNSIKQQNAKIASLEAQLATLSAQVQSLLNK